MLQNIQSASMLVAAAAKEAADATEDLRALISWADRTAEALKERDKEMVETMTTASNAIQTELAEFRKRADAMLKRLTGENGGAREKSPLEKALGREPTEQDIQALIHNKVLFITPPEKAYQEAIQEDVLTPEARAAVQAEALELPAALDRRNTEEAGNG